MTEFSGCESPGSPGGTDPGDIGVNVPLPEIPTDDFIGTVGDCQNEEQALIYDIYWNAYREYLHETYTHAPIRLNSKLEYEKIAYIPADVLNTYSEACKVLVREAQSRVGHTPLPLNSIAPATTGTTAAVAEKLVVFPNPAQTSFIVEITAENADLTIFNRFGQAIHQQSTQQSVEIKVEDWQPGIYFIEVVDTATNERKRGKLMVNR